MERKVFPAQLQQLDSMQEFIRKAGQEVGFQTKDLNRIKLASEEILVNIINYAYPEKSGNIEITIDPVKNKSLAIEISDNGIAFNPLEMPDPDLNAPLEERKIGGLGVYLVRKLMDEIRYERKDERNILYLVKYLDTAQAISEPARPAKAMPASGPGEYQWPLSYMKKETFKKGDYLFKAGDTADKMYYISKGSLKLVEINKVISEGHIIGEMGIFSPFKERTASALCEEDLEAYTMGKEEVLKFFAKDPNLAINLIQLSIKRFIENLKAETAARERIASELRIAQEIQSSMLPSTFPPFPDRKELDIYATMDPAKEVGGDFYDYFWVDKNKLCLTIGDVSGKGVPAALFMAISKTLFKSEAMLGLAPDEIVSRVNNLLCPDNQMCMFVTVFCTILNTDTGELQFCNGGHNPPLICTEGECFEYIDVPGGFVVGAIEDTKCENNSIILKPGDTFFLYTDGVTEAMNPKHELFSTHKLKESLQKVNTKDIKEMIGSVRRDVLAHAQGEPQSDDITMVALRFNGRSK